jgi:hypothetical protein
MDLDIMRSCHILRFQRLAQSCGPSGSVTGSIIVFIFRPVYFESVRPCRSSGRQVSLWLVNAETRLQFPGGSCGVCDGQSGIEVGFSQRCSVPPAS